MEQTENKSSKKLIVFEIVCVLIMIGLIGYTYSYFNISVTNNTAITGKAASLSLTLNVSKVAPSNTNGLIPQLDQYITSAVIGRNGSCIDDNNNNVCQVYQIKVKNTSAVSLYANGTVTLNANNNPNLKWAQISGTSSPTLVSSVNTPSTVKLVENELFTASEEKIYYIVVWISETGEAQYDTGSFTGTVTFGDANTLTAEATLNHLKILGFDGNVSDTVLTTFTTSSKLDGTTGIYEAEDDLGTSYYFRGNITNNYVKFGAYSEDAYQVMIYDMNTEKYTYSYETSCPETYYKCTKIASLGDDMYWRIVRINGDGSIRMIYDGTSAFDNNSSLKNIANNSIGNSFYNSKYHDNAFIGYMNGTVDETYFPSGGSNSTSYEEAHTNRTDSDLKKVTDVWYKKYLNIYGEYIVDSIFCNDRTVVTNEDLVNSMGATINGFGSYSTLYGIVGRINLTNGGLNADLKCLQDNDKFSIYTTIGNGNLTYPIGSLSVDEAVYSGVYVSDSDSEINDESFLYNSTYNYWLMSAFQVLDLTDLSGGVAILLMQNGKVIQNYPHLIDNFASKPVISISPDAIQYGTGTSTDPFRLTSEI